MSAEDIMDKLYMFQARFGKVNEFGQWDLERIQTDAGTLIPKEFQESISVRGLYVTVAAPNHK